MHVLDRLVGKRRSRALTVCWAVVVQLPGGAAHAIESQAIGQVRALPPTLQQVVRCGQWTAGSSTGHYRVVLIEVSSGAGTEVYVQRVQGGEAPRVVDTIPIEELNNDHAQYQVSTARCAGPGERIRIQLLATFEHDDADLVHRIDIRMSRSGAYSIRDTPTRASRK